MESAGSSVAWTKPAGSSKMFVAMHQTYTESQSQKALTLLFTAHEYFMLHKFTRNVQQNTNHNQQHWKAW
jgi:hypothetical protein